MKKSLIFTIIALSSYPVFAGNDIKTISDWKMVDDKDAVIAATDGASIEIGVDGKYFYDQKNIARLGIMCNKELSLMITSIVLIGSTPTGKNMEQVKYSYSMNYNKKPENKIVYDWKKVISKQGIGSLQNFSKDYPVEIMRADDSYYISIFSVEEKPVPVMYGFSLKGYREAIKPVLNACNISY